MFEPLARQFIKSTTNNNSSTTPPSFSGIEDDSLNVMTGGPFSFCNESSISFTKEDTRGYKSVFQIEPQNQLLQIVLQNRNSFLFTSFKPGPNDLLFIKKLNRSLLEFSLSSSLKNPSMAYHFTTPKRTISTSVDGDGEVSFGYLRRSFYKGIMFDYGGDLFHSLNSFNASFSFGIKAERERKSLVLLINPILSRMRLSASIFDKATASIELDGLTRSIKDVEIAFMNFKNFHLYSSLQKGGGLLISYSAIYKGISFSFKIPILPFKSANSCLKYTNDQCDDETYKPGIHLNISL